MKFETLVKSLLTEMPHIMYGQDHTFDLEIERYPRTEEGYHQLLNKLSNFITGKEHKLLSQERQSEKSFKIESVKQLLEFMQELKSNTQVTMTVQRFFNRSPEEFLSDIVLKAIDQYQQ